MSTEKPLTDELVDQIDADSTASVDDFIKELEAKEKDLHISSDLVIEVGESSVEHDNIHDSFVSAFAFTASSNEDEQDSEAEDEAERDEADQYAVLQEQIEDLIRERDGLMDSLRRHRIDFENYKARTERDREETFNRVLGGLAQQMLPVFDNLERALSNAKEPEAFTGEELGRFVEGIVLVSHQMSEVLEEMGVKPIRALGEPFDPSFHDAVDCVATDEHPPGHVVEELLRGYRIGDLVVRPSMVRVSEPASKNDGAE